MSPTQKSALLCPAYLTEVLQASHTSFFVTGDSMREPGCFSIFLLLTIRLDLLLALPFIGEWQGGGRRLGFRASFLELRQGQQGSKRVGLGRFGQLVVVVLLPGAMSEAKTTRGRRKVSQTARSSLVRFHCPLKCAGRHQWYLCGRKSIAASVEGRGFCTISLKRLDLFTNLAGKGE